MISDLKAKAVVAENEIAGLMACRARLEDRVRELEAEHPAEPADVPVDTWDERKLIFVNNIVEQFADGKQHSVGEITAAHPLPAASEQPPSDNAPVPPAASREQRA